MEQSGAQMRTFTTTADAASKQPQSQSQQTAASAKSAAGGAQKPHHNGCADVKPRLTKEQHDVLEAHFQQQHKPSTSTKKGFAEALGVPVDKINNWFQNRRAKVKQDLKKQINQYNMSMGIYGPPQIPQIPIVNSQFSQHAEQQQPQLPMTQDYYPRNADISPTSLPVQSVEGTSALDLGPQISLQQPFEMHHSLLSIPEADRTASYHPEVVLHSFMAATAGASYMQNNAVSLPSQDSGFSYDTNGLPSTFSNDLSFSVPSSLPNETASSNEVFSGFSDFNLDYSTLGTANHSSSAEVQNSAGSISSEPSPFSGTQSTTTTQSSCGPNTSSVASIASVYSGWTDDQNVSEIKPANDCDDPFEAPYNLPQASASEHALPFWGANGQGQAYSQPDFYQHHNSSAHAILSSPGQANSRKLSMDPSEFEAPPSFGDDAFARRNSSTSNLAHNIEAIHIQNTTPDGFKQPNQPSSIAARRHKRPTALNSNTLRSASYTAGMPSPGANNDHTLRRIRSTGIPNAAGRVQKPAPGSAQRSPMTLTFADAAASPKFARTFSSSSTTTLGQGGSLAPPTPLTPNDPARFPYWQNNTVIRNHPPMPEHSSPESLNANWAVEPQSAGIYSSGTSPPSTPLDMGQLNQTRLANENLYRDTPPQSAPATQQSFPRTAFMQPPQMRAGFHSTTDLTIAQPKPSHFRRPSLPDTGYSQLDESNMQYPVQFGSINYEDYKDIPLSGITHNVPFAPPVSAMPDFLVHEYKYTPPQGVSPHVNLLRPTTEPQQKSYIFANQGPHDFRSS